MIRTLLKRLVLTLMTCFISACGAPQLQCKPPETGDIVYVVGQGWHAELGLPVEEISGDLAFTREVFHGARVIMFGYGKKTFITAPPEAISEYFLGPVPGTAVIHVVGLNTTPLKAYAPRDTIVLRLPPGGRKALSDYIWKDMAKDAGGKPRIVARSSNPDGMFYAAESRYSLLHTCNTWTAEALHDTGLPVSGNWVSFSGQTMSRVAEAANSQCKP